MLVEYIYLVICRFYSVSNLQIFCVCVNKIEILEHLIISQTNNNNLILCIEFAYLCTYF